MKTAGRNAISRTLTGIIVIVVIIVIAAGTYFATTSTGSTSTTTTTTPTSSAPSQVVIGLPASLTGYASPFGTSCAQGAQLEAAQINATGGINGAMIKLVEIDDQSTAAQGSTVASELVNEYHVVGVVSCSTDEPLLAAGPEFDAAGIPEIVSLSGGPTVTAAIHDAFKVQLDASVQGFAAAKYLAGVLGQKKIAVLISDQAYTLLAAQGFNDAIANYGASVVYTKTTEIGTGSTDYATIMTSIQQSGATAVFFALFPPDAPTAIAQMGAAGMHDVAFATDTTDAGGNGTSNVAYGIAKQALTGVYWPSVFLQNSAAANSFVSSYQTKYGHSPDFFAALGHDSVKIMADAIQAGGFTSAGILGALPTVKDSMLLTSPINGFTSDRLRIMPVNIVEWMGSNTKLIVSYDQSNIITPLPVSGTTSTTAAIVQAENKGVLL